MKYLILPLIVILFAGTLFFVFKTTDSDDLKKQIESAKNAEENKKEAQPPQESNDEVTEEIVEETETDPAETILADEDVDQLPEKPADQNNEIDPEYSEEVDEEDFAEFIDAALEELDESEEMAEALLLEMKKIRIAQPDYENYIVRFYEGCLKKSGLASKIKTMCQDGLNEIK